MSIYGVFFRDTRGLDCWALLTRKRRALSVAKFNKGYVGVIRDAKVRRPASNGMTLVQGWDAPTFRALMEPLKDYRQ